MHLTVSYESDVSWVDFNGECWPGRYNVVAREGDYECRFSVAIRVSKRGSSMPVPTAMISGEEGKLAADDEAHQEAQWYALELAMDLVKERREYEGPRLVTEKTLRTDERIKPKPPEPVARQQPERQHNRSRRQLTDAFLEGIAQHYREALGDPSGSVSPNQYLVDTLHVPYSTAAYYVQKARERGFLRPALKGRAGEVSKREAAVQEREAAEQHQASVVHQLAIVEQKIKKLSSQNNSQITPDDQASLHAFQETKTQLQAEQQAAKVRVQRAEELEMEQVMKDEALREKMENDAMTEAAAEDRDEDGYEPDEDLDRDR